MYTAVEQEIIGERFFKSGWWH